MVPGDSEFCGTDVISRASAGIGVSQREEAATERA